MPGIMADNDSRGQLAVLRALLESNAYRELWRKVEFPFVEFESLGLLETASDVDVWRACQEREIILITGNRNAETPEALESTIRAYNDLSCLPVITIANPRRVMKSKAYAQKVVERLLQYLLDLDNYRA